MKNNNSGGNKKPKNRQNRQSILSNLRVIGDLIVGNITQIHLQFIFSDSSSAKQDFNTQKLPNIKALLNKGKNWVKVLHNTLAYKGELPDFNIQLEELPNAVKQNPGFDKAVYTPQQILSEDIINAFVEMGEGERSLLILGEPGSGKTTILLKLLAKLINNFGEDFNKPVPVYFNLSSWTRGQENFADWLAKELKQRYHVISLQIVNQLIERQLLLLLDGLDEVKLEDRKDCVQKLNKFIEGHAVIDIVVCSRLQEYEEVLGSDCHLEEEQFVYRIATVLIVGLFFGLIVGCYFVYLLESMNQDKMITIAITNNLRVKLITIGLLPGLISTLITGLLPTFSNRWISGCLQGMMFISFLFLVFNLFEPQLLRVYVPPIYLAGIFGGTCFTLIRTEIQPVEIWQPEWRQIINFSLIFGALGIFYMVARRFFIMPEFYKDKPFYVIYDVIAVMIVGAVYGGLRIRKYPEPPEQGEPNQGIKRSATYSIISFTISALIAILCAYIFDQVKNSILIFLGLSVGLLGGLGANQGSGIVCIQHFILRVILCYRGYIPWNYSHFLNYAIERVFLRKSGGAYLFIHRKLMDYFAKMEQSSAIVSRK